MYLEIDKQWILLGEHHSKAHQERAAEHQLKHEHREHKLFCQAHPFSPSATAQSSKGTVSALSSRTISLLCDALNRLSATEDFGSTSSAG